MDDKPAHYCVVCGSDRVDACHIKSRGAGGTTDENNIFYACRIHHIEQHQIGIVSFAMKYKKVFFDFEKKGWVIQSHFGRLRVVRRDGAVNDEGVTHAEDNR